VRDKTLLSKLRRGLPVKVISGIATSLVKDTRGSLLAMDEGD